MANYILKTWDQVAQREKLLNSSAITIDVLGIRIGASNLLISESGGHFDFGAKELRNVVTGTGSSNAATKGYVDSQIELVSSGFDPKASVDLATTEPLPANTPAGSGVGKTLTADANGALTVDGVTPPFGSVYRILVGDEVDPVQNGIYDLTQGDGSTPWVLTRSSDFDGSPAGEVTRGARTVVSRGTTLKGFIYFLDVGDPVVVDTDALVWAPTGTTVEQATGAAGGGTQGVATFDTDKGLEVTAGVVGVKHDGEGLAFAVGGNLSLELDGSTLSKSGAGLKVADEGVGTGQLADTSVTSAKIAAAVAGAGLTGGAGSALAVGAGPSIRVLNDAVAVDYAETFLNSSGGSVGAGQFVFLNANQEIVALAQANEADANDYDLGIVEDASIADGVSGRVICKPGALVSGFAFGGDGAVYVSRTTAGEGVQSLAGFVSGEFLYEIGRPKGGNLKFNPHFHFEF